MKRNTPTTLSADALTALRAATIHDDGGVDLAPAGNLPRPVYDEVNAVLAEIGAKWHRGRKLHLFTETWDRGMFDDVRSTGEAPPANPRSYFATPRAVADDLLTQNTVCDRLRHYGNLTVLEPSAGTGALARAVVDAWAVWVRDEDATHDPAPDMSDGQRRRNEWYAANLPRLRVVLVEVDVRRARILRDTVIPELRAAVPGRVEVDVVEGDWLQVDATTVATPAPDLVVMNPPFSAGPGEAGGRMLWAKHLRRALELVHRWGVVACIAPTNWRHGRPTKDMLEALQTISRADVWDFPAAAFAASGTLVPTCGLVVKAENVRDDVPLTTHPAVVVIENDEDMLQRVKSLADVAVEDKRWRALALELSVNVARGGDMVSFADEYQVRLVAALQVMAGEATS